MQFKQLNRLVALLFILFSISEVCIAQNKLPIGSELPMADVGMEDVTGRNLSLNGIADENGLLVLFNSNTCPWVLLWQDRILELSVFTDENNIGMVALNSNEGYRDRGDALEDMIKHAEKAAYDFPYLLDENHVIADAFGASRTPQVFIFNGELQLVYKGVIDDNANNANRVENSFAMQAMEAMLGGQTVQTSTSRLVGCTIKRAG